MGDKSRDKKKVLVGQPRPEVGCTGLSKFESYFGMK